MEFPSEIVAEAARRWQDRQPKREQQREALRRGQITEAETPERIARRLTRLSAASSRARSRVQGRAVPTLVETIGLERVLGKADFLGIQFVELALAVARFVGRVHIRQRPGRTAGFGTGFMVSPRLLLTNNHVLPSADFATHSEIEFDYQYDRRGHLLPVIVFGLEPEAFLLTDQALDYTLVAVRPTSLTGTDLQLYGWSRLDPTEGKALLGDALNVIQHPKGEAKQIVLRSNQLVDLFDHFAHYVTDTEPGSSGAPVYNDEWEVVALHHSGVPRTDAAGNYLAKDGTIWRPGMDTDQIAWVANEGIRVSSLVDHVKRQPMPNDSWRAVRTQLLELQPPDPLEAAAIAASPATGPRVGAASAPVTSLALASPALDITVPIQISVRVGDVQSGQVRVEAGVTGASMPGGTGGRKPSESGGQEEARARLNRARRATYYDGSEDARARQAYYRDIVVEGQTPEQLYRTLSALVQHTHTTTFSYTDARQQHLYPVVDLHPDGKLRSLYTRDEYSPRRSWPRISPSPRRCWQRRCGASALRPGARHSCTRSWSCWKPPPPTTRSTSCRSRGSGSAAPCAAICTTSSPARASATASAATRPMRSSRTSGKPIGSGVADGWRTGSSPPSATVPPRARRCIPVAVSRRGERKCEGVHARSTRPSAGMAPSRSRDRLRASPECGDSPRTGKPEPVDRLPGVGGPHRCVAGPRWRVMKERLAAK